MVEYGLWKFQGQSLKNCDKIQSKTQFLLRFFADIELHRTSITCIHTLTRFRTFGQEAMSRNSCGLSTICHGANTLAGTSVSRTTTMMLTHVFSDHSCVQISTEHCIIQMHPTGDELQVVRGKNTVSDLVPISVKDENDNTRP